MISYWILLTLASAILFSIKDIMAKKWLKHEHRPRNIIMGENLILLFLMIIFLYDKVNYLSYKQIWWLYLLKGLAVGGGALIYFRLLKENEVSIVSPLINLSPLFLMLFSSFILLERLSFIQIMGVILIVISTYFLELNKHAHIENTDHKIHLIQIITKDSKFIVNVILMLLLFTFAAIFDKMILKQVDVMTDMFFTGFVILIMGIMFSLNDFNIKNLISKPIFILSLVGILSNFLILTVIALPDVFVSLIIPIRRTSTLFTAFFGGILFHEKHLSKKMISVLGMVIGLFLMVS